MSQNRGYNSPFVHPLGECEWGVVVVMTPTGDNSWLVYQSLLAVLPTETSAASRRDGRRNENFLYSVSWYVNGFLHALKSYSIWSPALLSIWRKVCCGFLSSLKIYRLGRVWTHDPWVHYTTEATSEAELCVTHIHTGLRCAYFQGFVRLGSHWVIPRTGSNETDSLILLRGFYNKIWFPRIGSVTKFV
jgi:hypothetical protein